VFLLDLDNSAKLRYINAILIQEVQAMGYKAVLILRAVKIIVEFLAEYLKVDEDTVKSHLVSVLDEDGDGIPDDLQRVNAAEVQNKENSYGKS